MNWNEGYESEFHMAIVDPVTWRDIQRVRIEGGSCARTDSGLRQSADIDCNEFDDDREQWIRVWHTVRQKGERAREALFTGLASVPETRLKDGQKKTPLECYSVLKPAEELPLQRGWYAPAGIPAAKICQQLLDPIPAPVIISENSPALEQAIIAEDDETPLTMVDKILEAIGWRLMISGYGEVRILPLPSEPIATFGPQFDIIETTVDIEPDWFGCPNVFRAIADDLTAVARDDSPSSALSTVNRGREVWMTETNCDLNEKESIEEYAIRRLAEEQRHLKKMSYTRRFVPEINVSDIIRMHYPDKGLQGDYTVASQTIQFSHNASVAEGVEG